MKRTIIAFILGAVLATAGSVYAEEVDTLIGKQVQGEFPVKVNGEEIDKKAIVIDGTSYLPVRAIGEALNMDIKFDADLGIELTEKEDTTMETTSTTEMSPEDKAEIENAQNQIATANQRMIDAQNKLKEYEKELAVEREKLDNTTDPSEKEMINANIAMINGYIESANFQIESSQKIISDFQAYIEKIKAKYASN